MAVAELRPPAMTSPGGWVPGVSPGRAVMRTDFYEGGDHARLVRTAAELAAAGTIVFPIGLRPDADRGAARPYAFIRYSRPGIPGRDPV
ncbi:hypothetical protein [Nocardia carnea]|uniref:hypothetical protein n=1 Tax=Nocardia carnea TaxID=37328 RepID=UPI00245521CB|nr:hypothetical protein [Nocardia carnea]